MTSAAPRLFDKAFRRNALSRAARKRPAFYAQTLAGEIESRFGLILREFAVTLVYGPAAGEIGSRLRLLKRLGHVITAAPEHESGIDLVFDDETMPLAPESVDCIVSLFSLNSIDDVPGSLAQIRAALKPDGLFFACLFAGRTLIELREAWLAAEADISGGASLRLAPLADLRDLGGLLQRAGFALPAVDMDVTIVRYRDSLSLMHEIKALGFGHALAERSRKPVTAALLARAAALYDQRFADPDGRIRATIETAWLIGWAPHSSQPRALRPGSAQARLADALRTRELPLKGK
jgi:SAM-dependent methyltransferase